jgi:hypothetical protein
MEIDLPADKSTPSSAAPPSISDATLIRRTVSVLSATVGEEIVMMNAESGRYLGLDAIGSDIWRRLETPCSFGSLVDALAADYEADRAVIAEDVRKLLAEMAAQDLVKFG